MTVRTSSLRRHDALGPTLLLFALILFGLSVQGAPILSPAVVAAAVALWIAFAWLGRGSLDTLHAADPNWDVKLLIGVVVFGVAGALGWSPSVIGPTSPALEVIPGIAWASVGLVVYGLRDRIGNFARIGIVIFTLGLTLVVGLSHLSAARGIGFDVLHLHHAAAGALAEGMNPYTDAVTVNDGSPTAEPGDVIEGYVYPPVTALFYAIGDWSLSDPRYTSLAAWLVFLAVLGFTSVRRKNRHLLYVMLLMAAVPGWPLVLRAAWTEPLTLAFFAISFVAWQRPASSGVGLGFALASKQYFAVVAPILLLFRGMGWLKRVMVAFVVLATTIGLALIWDADAFLTAAVEFHTSTPPRSDSLNLVGLASLFGYEFDPSTILTIGVGVGAAVLAGRFARERVGFMLAFAVALASSFLVSSQAFANYWFLICGLCGLGLFACTEVTARPQVDPLTTEQAAARSVSGQ